MCGLLNHVLHATFSTAFNFGGGGLQYSCMHDRLASLLRKFNPTKYVQEHCGFFHVVNTQ